MARLVARNATLRAQAEAEARHGAGALSSEEEDSGDEAVVPGEDLAGGAALPARKRPRIRAPRASETARSSRASLRTSRRPESSYLKNRRRHAQRTPTAALPALVLWEKGEGTNDTEFVRQGEQGTRNGSKTQHCARSSDTKCACARRPRRCGRTNREWERSNEIETDLECTDVLFETRRGTASSRYAHTSRHEQNAGKFESSRASTKPSGRPRARPSQQAEAS